MASRQLVREYIYEQLNKGVTRDELLFTVVTLYPGYKVQQYNRMIGLVYATIQRLERTKPYAKSNLHTE